MKLAHLSWPFLESGHREYASHGISEIQRLIIARSLLKEPR
jgi:hypothetical protein